MLLGSVQEAVEVADLGHRSHRQPVFPQCFPNSLLPKYPWHCAQKPCVSAAPLNQVPAALVVQGALDLPTLLQARVLQEDLGVREVGFSEYDQDRYG